MNFRPYLFTISLTRSQVPSFGSLRDRLIFTVHSLSLFLIRPWYLIIFLWIVENLEIVVCSVTKARRGGSVRRSRSQGVVSSETAVLEDEGVGTWVSWVGVKVWVWVCIGRPNSWGDRGGCIVVGGGPGGGGG